MRLLLGLMLLTACGPSQPAGVGQELGADPLRVEASFEQEPLTRTGNALRIHVRSSAGAAITGATVRVTVVMPTHGHAAPAPQVEELADGDYRAADLNFTMAGTWAVQATATRGNASGYVSIEAESP